MQVNRRQQPVGLSLEADLDLLLCAFVIEQFHPLADEGDRAFEEALVDDDGTVLVNPSVDGFTEIITEVLRR